jgi:hypothetical protein
MNLRCKQQREPTWGPRATSRRSRASLHRLNAGLPYAGNATMYASSSYHCVVQPWPAT